MSDESGRPVRLLAIDDNADSANLIVRVARRCGFEAQALTVQTNMMASVAEWSPDILTLDLCMPGDDGIRVMSSLAASGFKGSIVIISGQDDWFRKSAGRLAAGHGLKVAGDMSKPVDIEKLGAFLTRLRTEAATAAA